MARIVRTVRYQGTIEIPLSVLPYAIPGGGTFNPQAFEFQPAALFPAMARMGYNGTFNAKTYALVGGKIYVLTPTAILNYDKAAPNVAPTGGYTNSYVYFTDRIKLISQYTSNVSALVTLSFQAGFNTKTITYFATPGGGAVSTPVGETMAYADRYDPYPKRPILFYTNSSLHVGNFFLGAYDGINGPTYSTIIQNSDVTEPQIAQADQILTAGYYGQNFLLASRSPVLKNWVSLQAWSLDPLYPPPPTTPLGNAYEIVLDNPTLQAVMLNASKGTNWRFGVWAGGFMVCLRTAGAGPTGQQNEVVVMDHECLNYLLIKFIPQDAQTTAAMGRVNVAWSVKITPTGDVYMRSMSGTDDTRAFYGPWGSPQVQSPPALSWALPCYIPCDPTLKEEPMK